MSDKKVDYAEMVRQGVKVMTEEYSIEKFDENVMMRELHLPEPVMKYLTYNIGKQIGWFNPIEMSWMMEFFGAMSVREIMEEIRRKDDVFYLA